VALILVVDDDPLDRMIVESLLQLDDHEIVFAEDGQVALDLCKKRRFDLIVTDLVMPNVNGLRLIQELRRMDRKVRIVAITGAHAGALFTAEQYGALAVLAKPLDRDSFLAAVTDVVGKKP
jgi:CheY-like chemotaxis protein